MEDQETKELIEMLKGKKMPEDVKRETIRGIRKRARDEQRFAKMSKADRLKKICSEAIDTCFGFAFEHGVMIGHGDLKPTKGEVETFKFLRTQAKSGLTWELKRAGVLP